MRMLILALILAACEPAPGETRCSSTMVYGTAFTRCRQGPEVPRGPLGWWCSTRDDGYGVCARGPGQCEAWRGTVVGFAPCIFLSMAICASIGPTVSCYTSPAVCASAERYAGRDGSLCLAQQ